MKNLTNNFIPVLPMRNLLLFPGIASPVRVGRAKSVAAIKKALENDGHVIAILQKSENTRDEKLSPDELYKVGTLCKIEKTRGDAQKGFQIILRGISRIRISEIIEKNGYIQAEGTEWKDVV